MMMMVYYYMKVNNLKGKKSGKGKEYEDGGKIEFEGEYLNGERNGKGKEYFLQGQGLLFEGEFLEGKRWTGKGYDENLNVVLELNNGKGKGKQFSYLTKRLLYDGEFLNGKRHGKGKEYNRYEGLWFEGEYSNGKRHGKGKEYNNMPEEPLRMTFEGEFLNGKKSGKGKEYDNDGKIIFYGEYLNNTRWNGMGKEFEMDYDDKWELKFEGEYVDGYKFEDIYEYLNFINKLKNNN